MLYSLIFFMTSLLTFLIFTEIITINIHHSELTVIDVNFRIFAIRYTKLANKKSADKERLKRKFIPTPAIFSYVVNIIEKSCIDIELFSLGKSSASPAASAVGSGILSSLAAIAVAYAKENAKKFTSDNITFSTSEHNNLKLDAKITISLFNFIICTLPFIFKVVGLRFKRLKGEHKIWQKTR